MSTSLKKKCVLIFKGMAMGAADVVPGVSGGTVAFITGIYEDLIHFLGSFKLNEAKALVGLLGGPKKRQQSIEILKKPNWSFFIPLAIGICISILSLSKLIVAVMEAYPVQTYAFFFGLILFSVRFPFEQMQKTKMNFIIVTATAIFAFIFFSMGGEFQGDPSHLLYVFISGAIAICALILPGISGSTFLVLLGMYKPILAAIHSRDMVTIGIFMMGMLVGILSFIQVLKWLLEKHYSYTMAGLTGLMLGSLKKVWPLSYAPEGDPLSSWAVPVLACMCMGVLVIFLLEKFSRVRTDKIRPQ